MNSPELLVSPLFDPVVPIPPCSPFTFYGNTLQYPYCSVYMCVFTCGQLFGVLPDTEQVIKMLPVYTALY